MLQGKFVGHYRKQRTPAQIAANQPGTVVFRYTVSGTDSELIEYEETQGDNFREDDQTKEPLFFTTNYSGDVISLIITQNKRVVVDTSDTEKLASLVDQHRGPLQAALAERAADEIFARRGSSRRASVVEKPEVKEKESSDLEN